MASMDASSHNPSVSDVDQYIKSIITDTEMYNHQQTTVDDVLFASSSDDLNVEIIDIPGSHHHGYSESGQQ